MRHLVTALIALGEYEEAELALESYAELISKRDAIISRSDAVAAVQNETKETTAENNSTSNNENSRNSVEHSITMAVPAVREDAEYPQKVVETLLIGARLMMTDLAKVILIVIMNIFV
jgi:hypothetical protein